MFSPPQTPPLLSWFSFFLERSSANFVKKIQKLAEDKAENPRTCRGQSREKKIRTDAYQKTEILKLCSSILLCLTATVRTPKTLGGGTPPPGGLQSAAHRVRRVESLHQGLLVLLLISFWILLLRGSCFPLLNPPPPGPGRLHLLRRSAAFSRLGAS